MGARTSIALGLVAAAVSLLAPNVALALATTGLLGILVAAAGALRWSGRARREPVRHRWLALAAAAGGALIFAATFFVGEGGLYTLVELVCGALLFAMGMSSYWVTQPDKGRSTRPFAPRAG